MCVDMCVCCSFHTCIYTFRLSTNINKSVFTPQNKSCLVDSFHGSSTVVWMQKMETHQNIPAISSYVVQKINHIFLSGFIISFNFMTFVFGNFLIVWALFLSMLQQLSHRIVGLEVKDLVRKHWTFNSNQNSGSKMRFYHSNAFCLHLQYSWHKATTQISGKRFAKWQPGLFGLDYRVNHQTIILGKILDVDLKPSPNRNKAATVWMCLYGVCLPARACVRAKLIFPCINLGRCPAPVGRSSVREGKDLSCLSG